MDVKDPSVCDNPSSAGCKDAFLYCTGLFGEGGVCAISHTRRLKGIIETPDKVVFLIKSCLINQRRTFKVKFWCHHTISILWPMPCKTALLHRSYDDCNVKRRNFVDEPSYPMDCQLNHIWGRLLVGLGLDADGSDGSDGLLTDIPSFLGCFRGSFGSYFVLNYVYFLFIIILLIPCGSVGSVGSVGIIDYPDLFSLCIIYF